MAARLKLIKYVLVAAADADDYLLRRSIEIQGSDSIKLVEVKTCDAVLRYLDQFKKETGANEIWIFPGALGKRTPQFFAKALRYRSPSSEIFFVYATEQPYMRKCENIVGWWIPTQSSK